MKRAFATLLCLLTICTGATVAGGSSEPCPQPIVKIKGPCPSPCPAAPACVCPAPVVVEKIVQAPAPAPEIRYVPTTVTVPGPTRVVREVVPDRRHGLVLPLSVFKVGPVKGAAVGLGYQFRNRMILSGQVVFADNGSVDTLNRTRVETYDLDSDGTSELPPHCTDGHGQDGVRNRHCRPSDDGETMVFRRSRSSSSERGRDTGAMLTLTIPLGR